MTPTPPPPSTPTGEAIDPRVGKMTTAQVEALLATVRSGVDKALPKAVQEVIGLLCDEVLAYRAVSPSPVAQGEREAFEKWARAEWPAAFDYNTTALMWSAWQASRALPPDAATSTRGEAVPVAWKQGVPTSLGWFLVANDDDLFNSVPVLFFKPTDYRAEEPVLVSGFGNHNDSTPRETFAGDEWFLSIPEITAPHAPGAKS